MTIDYETVRRNNPAPPPGSDWAERERLAVEKVRAEMAAAREQDQHKRDVQAYAKFCTRNVEAATQAGDERRARVWEQAAREIERGNWLVDKVIASDPAVTAYQGLRTTLLYQGKTSKVKGQ